jgi:hypothetical protein
LWSSGKKNATALRARPLLALHLDLSGTCRQHTFRQLFLDLGDAFAWLLALGTTRRPLLACAHHALHGDMLLQEEGSEFLAQQAGHVFPLGEGHELILVRFREHPFECFPGAEQPAFSKCLAILAIQKSTPFHGIPSKSSQKLEQLTGNHANRKRCPQKRGCTRAKLSACFHAETA